MRRLGHQTLGHVKGVLQVTTAEPITIKTSGDTFTVEAPWTLRDLCRAIPGCGFFDHQARAWQYPAIPETAVALSDAFVGHAPVTDAEFDRLVAEGRPVVVPESTEHLEPPPLVKTKPWAHQISGYHMIRAQAATMLNDDMGVGKTKTVIDAIVNLECQRTLIVCPKSVLAVWPAEFEKHAARPVRVVVLDTGTVAKRTIQADLAIKLAFARREPLALVVNYEAAWRLPLARLLIDRHWDMIVADEIHRIKSATGKASKYMHRLGRCAERRVGCAERRVGLTGTLMPHSPLDVFGAYRFLDPRIFGTSWTLFRARYSLMGGFVPPGRRSGVQVLGFQNLDELHRKVFSIGRRIEKRDVLDLPPVLHETRYVELGAKAARVYRDLEKDFIAQVEAGIVTASNALTKLLRLQQVTSGYVRLDTEETNGKIVDVAIDNSKANAFGEILEDLPRDESVVVFCLFHHDLDVIGEVARDIGRISYELSGRMNELCEWQQAGEGSVLAVQIKAGGVGIDLTRAAYCVYYATGFSNGDYEQSLARLDRPGQTRSVTYIHLIARGTIDERVREALALRRNIVQHVLTLAQPKGDDECLEVVPKVV